MNMIAPPFPIPNQWNDICKEQERTGIVKWTVSKDKHILAMAESIKQQIISYNQGSNNDNDNNNNGNKNGNDYNNNGNNNNNNNGNNNSNNDDDDNSNEYEEVLEVNPFWISKLAPTIQKLNRLRQKAKKSNSKKMKYNNNT